jgi:hypothetical protein
MMSEAMSLATLRATSGRTENGGGEHDAGVPEHVLDDFQVGARSEGEDGGAVAQVVPADRRQAAGVVELAEVARQPVRRHGVTVEPSEHVSRSLERSLGELAG